MPLPLGHTAIGLATYETAQNNDHDASRWSAFALIAVLANLPDIDIVLGLLFQGNGNLFLNMVSWLAQDEDLISIRPKPQDDRRILLTQSQLSILKLITIYGVPGIALIAGIVVVINRRRR